MSPRTDASDRYLGGCDRAATVLGLAHHHCESCHEDADMGYEMCEIYTRAGWYEACCKVADERRDRSLTRKAPRPVSDDLRDR